MQAQAQSQVEVSKNMSKCCQKGTNNVEHMFAMTKDTRYIPKEKLKVKNRKNSK